MGAVERPQDEREEAVSAEDQVQRLADFIMAEIPNEPSQSEGAGDTATRLLGEYRAVMSAAMSELGVPNDHYPAPVANAHAILKRTLTGGSVAEEISS